MSDTSDTEIEKSLFEAPPMGEQERMVEAILFATAEPVTFEATILLTLFTVPVAGVSAVQVVAPVVLGMRYDVLP